MLGQEVRVWVLHITPVAKRKWKEKGAHPQEAQVIDVLPALFRAVLPTRPFPEGTVFFM